MSLRCLLHPPTKTVVVAALPQAVAKVVRTAVAQEDILQTIRELLTLAFLESIVALWSQEFPVFSGV